MVAGLVSEEAQGFVGAGAAKAKPGSKAAPFSDGERAAVYRAIAERRDVRRGFLPEPLPDDVLDRLLHAAHQSPSVGLMQPTRFIVVRDAQVRRRVYEAFLQANVAASAGYDDVRRERYAGLKLDGLLEAPQHICLVCETGSARGHGLGRQTMPETAVYSTVCAAQNLWLAARAEGVGVGWVSIFEPAALRAILELPEALTPVAYLCVGYVDRFAEGPDLERFGWEWRAKLTECVRYERWGGASEDGH